MRALQWLKATAINLVPEDSLEVIPDFEHTHEIREGLLTHPEQLPDHGEFLALGSVGPWSSAGRWFPPERPCSPPDQTYSSKPSGMSRTIKRFRECVNYHPILSIAPKQLAMGMTESKLSVVSLITPEAR